MQLILLEASCDSWNIDRGCLLFGSLAGAAIVATPALATQLSREGVDATQFCVRAGAVDDRPPRFSAPSTRPRSRARRGCWRPVATFRTEWRYNNCAMPGRSHRRKTIMLIIFALFLVPILARAVVYAIGDSPRSWSDADWSSTHLLPSAAQDKAARAIVFTGTTGAWKGIFSVHSWIVLKPANAQEWTRYDVVGWGSPVRVNGWPPDGLWYGNEPVAIADISGSQAETLIPKIEAAVAAYRFAKADDYKVWPGPNSNSFTAAILRAVPELGVSLPPNAVGRDYRDRFYAGLTDSRTGFELNLYGLAALKIGWVEGIEVDLLGLVAGLDFRHPGLKLPGYGRIGIESPVATALAR
jgi:hypothetical protein